MLPTACKTCYYDFQQIANRFTNRWEYISGDCAVPEHEFLEAVQFVLNSIYFTFDNQIYKQNFGTPMGSPLSLVAPVIANIVARLERQALDILGFW